MVRINIKGWVNLKNISVYNVLRKREMWVWVSVPMFVW